MSRPVRGLIGALIGAGGGVLFIIVWYVVSIRPYDTMGYGALGALVYSGYAVVIGGLLGGFIGLVMEPYRKPPSGDDQP